MMVQQWDSARSDVAERLAATLDVELENFLPACWHWALFTDPVPTRKLGRDGHRAEGGLIPCDPELPARMWAGGRIKFHRAVELGCVLRRETRIRDITEREGRSGRLRFVVLQHLVFAGEEVVIEEEQDLVYRQPAAPRMAAGAAPPAPPGAWRRATTPDEIMLFRFSALTFNAHRIHYDRDYATSVEHYPDLVVHGPLQAILLAGHLAACRPGLVIRQFGYRAQGPAYVNRELHLEAWPDADDADAWHLHSRDPAGAICMSAHAVLHPSASQLGQTA
jgi:3-methylfumaryl-CoA hydratase